MCDKQSTRSFLILLHFPSLIFSSIYPTFTVTKFLTPIFFLCRLSSFLLFVIVPTGKLVVDLGGVIRDQTVFQFQQKIESIKKLPRALRTNNYSLRESYRVSSSRTTCNYRSALRNLPPLDFLDGDCTQNHTLLKYNSYRVNFWQKILMYQEGIFRIIFMKIIVFSQLYRSESVSLEMAYDMKIYSLSFILWFPLKQ